MSEGESREGTEESGSLWDVAFYYLLAAVTIFGTGGLVVGSLLDTGPFATALVGLWLLSYVPRPVLCYLDLRQLRKADQWRPKARGALWALGLVVPFASPSVAATYALRRREITVHDGYWSRWQYVTGAMIVVLVVSLVSMFALEDPSLSGNTPGQNASIYVFMAMMLLPGLTTFFDVAALRRTWGKSVRRYHWLWVPAMVVWFVQIPVFVAYAVWRNLVVSDPETFETVESTLDGARSHLVSGVEAHEADQYESAVERFDRAGSALEEARATLDEMRDGPVEDQPRRVSNLLSDAADLEARLRDWQSRTTTATAARAGERALEQGDYGAAVERFEAARQRAESAIERTDDETAAAALRTTLERARDGIERGRERIVDERLAPLETEIGSAESDGVEALDDGEYDLAIERFEAVRDGVAEYLSLVDTHGIDREPPITPDAVDERLAAANRQRVVVEEIEPLEAEVESAYSEGIEALDAGDYDTAIDCLATAETQIDRVESRVDEHGLDREPPVTADDVAQQVEAVREGRKRARVEEHVERARREREAGEAAVEADEYETAVEAFETAREELDAAAAVDGTATEELGVEERRVEIAGLYENAVEQREERRYRDPFERGEQHRERAESAAEAGRYDDVVAACESAREAYDEAMAAACSGSDVGDESAVRERVEEVVELRSDYEVRALSDRVTDARVTGDEGENARYREAAEELADIVAELESLDAERERDVDIVEEEAQRERIRALLLAERERVERAVEATERGEYATGRDRFEEISEALDDLRATAVDAGITAYDGAIDELAAVCERNADAARRADLGIVDAPSLSSVSVPIGGDASGTGRASDASTRDIRRVADGSDGSTAAGSVGGSADTSAGVERSLDDSLRGELPAHEEIGHVGSGGNADVYEVRLESGDHAALKVPRWQGTISTRLVEEFASEAETWSKLDDHDHIVPVLGWGESPYPWLLLEFLPASLADRVDGLSVDTGLDVLVDVADALEFAHGRGVVHLDVKPENVLLTAEDVPKVGDWGLSQVVLDHTRTGMGLTPPYSAPEQLSDEFGDIDRRTDVYQLSVLAYRILTGRLPFGADRPLDLQEQILNEDPTPPSVVEPTLPPAVDEVILTGLSKDPADRYDAAVLFRNELAALRE